MSPEFNLQAKQSKVPVDPRVYVRKIPSEQTSVKTSLKNSTNLNFLELSDIDGLYAPDPQQQTFDPKAETRSKSFQEIDTDSIEKAEVKVPNTITQQNSAYKQRPDTVMIHHQASEKVRPVRDHSPRIVYKHGKL